MLIGMWREQNPLIGLLLVALMVLPGVASATTARALEPELRGRLTLAMAKASARFDRFDAEVWLTDYSRRLVPRLPDHSERLELLRLIHIESERVELPPELVLAVIQIESNFDRFAISSAGARGLMQIMPFWLEEIGRPDDDLFTPQVNVRFGCTILRYYLDMEKGDWTRALARYNGSLGSSRYPNKVFAALRKNWRQH